MKVKTNLKAGGGSLIEVDDIDVDVDVCLLCKDDGKDGGHKH